MGGARGAGRRGSLPGGRGEDCCPCGAAHLHIAHARRAHHGIPCRFPVARSKLMSSNFGETLSLRPLSLRSGTGPSLGPSSNPFAAFKLGAGTGSRRKVRPDVRGHPARLTQKPCHSLESAQLLYAADLAHIRLRGQHATTTAPPLLPQPGILPSSQGLLFPACSSQPQVVHKQRILLAPCSR